MDIDEIKKRFTESLAPINIEELIHDGIIEKTRSKNKYKLLKAPPRELGSKVTAFKQTPKGVHVTIYSDKKLRP